MSVYEWKLTCETHGDITFWSQTEPTTCNINITDVIIPGSVRVLQSITPNEVVIREEDTPTQGIFQCTTRVLDIDVNPNVFSFSWPYPISVCSMKFKTNEDHVDDVINLSPAPKTLAGVLISSLTNVLEVSPSSGPFKLGYYVFVGDSDEEGGRIINVTGNTVTVENPITSPPGSVLKLTRKGLDEYTIGLPNDHVVGLSKMGASYLPGNMPVIIDYHNESGLSKKLYIQVELLY